MRGSVSCGVRVTCRIFLNLVHFFQLNCLSISTASKLMDNFEAVERGGLQSRKLIKAKLCGVGGRVCVCPMGGV